MDTSVWIFTIITAVWFVAASFLRKQKYKWPPGPSWWNFSERFPVYSMEGVERMRDKYGKLSVQRSPIVNLVHCFEYQDAKEIFMRSDSIERLDSIKMFNINPEEDVGVAFTNGPQWAHGRKFMQKHLRSLGPASSKVDEAVEAETRTFMEFLKKRGTTPAYFPEELKITILNVLWQFTASRCYPLDDRQVHKIFEKVEDVKYCALRRGIAKDLLPFLKYLPQFMQDALLGKDEITEFLTRMEHIVQKSITEHEETLDMDDPKDLVDDYLTQIATQPDDAQPRARIEALHQIMHDIFNTGHDSVYGTMKWMEYFSVKYPDVAARCRQEIDSIVAKDELVRLKHRPHLQYVEAFTCEVLRRSCVLGYTHRQLSNDTRIRDYLMPKGTIFNISIYHLHHDEKYWDKPYDFNPLRFLDKNGKLKTRVDAFVSFGMGRRDCPGQVLARTQLFLFGANYLKTFDISLPEGVPLNEERIKTNGFMAAPRQKFVYTLR